MSGGIDRKFERLVLPSPKVSTKAGQDHCENLYQAHYCSASNSVCNINRVTGVGNNGGMELRICRFEGHVTSQFTCWYVDIPNATGDTSYWKQNPKEGSDTISPLAFAFYVWTNNDPNPDQEVRTWIKDDTGYAKGEIRAKRNDGADSRDGLRWVDVVSPNQLCDFDLRRGVCG